MASQVLLYTICKVCLKFNNKVTSDSVVTGWKLLLQDEQDKGAHSRHPPSTLNTYTEADTQKRLSASEHMEGFFERTVMQREVSQKEENQYHILLHIYEDANYRVQQHL